jgi:hypothetical protein
MSRATTCIIGRHANSALADSTFATYRNFRQATLQAEVLSLMLVCKVRQQ